MSNTDNEKNVYELLFKNYCEEEGAKLNELLRRIQTVCDFSTNEKHPLQPIKEPLKKAIYFADSNSGGRNAKFYRWISFLHLAFEIPIECFELPETDSFNIKLKSIDIRNSKLHSLKQFQYTDESKAMTSKYFSVAHNFLRNINESLYIYDYLERFKDERNTKKEEYVKAHDDIFTEIEEKLKKIEGRKAIKYARFLVLPLSVETRKNSFQKRVPKKDIVDKIISLMSVALFKHICYCLIENPNFQIEDLDPDDIKECQGGFYIVPYPSRIYSFAYGDSGKICMTEHYRFNRFSKAKADLLFVDDGLGETNKLSAVYKKEIVLHFSKSEKLLLSDIENVMKGTRNSVLNGRNESVDAYEKKLDDLNGQLRKTEEALKDNMASIKVYRNDLNKPINQQFKEKQKFFFDLIENHEKEQEKLKAQYEEIQEQISDNKLNYKKSIVATEKINFFDKEILPKYNEIKGSV